MADATLQLKAAGSLADASLDLMPFHVAHTGPAPLSTYFRVAPAPASATDEPAKEQYVAAFRGRAVHGTRVALPEGYVGVMLQSDAQASTSAPLASPTKTRTASPARRGRKTRSSTVRSEPEPEPVQDEPAQDVDMLNEDLLSPDATATRFLTPSGKFESMVVWGADYAVDEASDDHVRSLNEWARLAAEVCRRPNPPSLLLTLLLATQASSHIATRECRRVTL